MLHHDWKDDDFQILRVKLGRGEAWMLKMWVVVVEGGMWEVTLLAKCIHRLKNSLPAKKNPSVRQWIYLFVFQESNSAGRGGVCSSEWVSWGERECFSWTCFMDVWKAVMETVKVKQPASSSWVLVVSESVKVQNILGLPSITMDENKSSCSAASVSMQVDSNTHSAPPPMGLTKNEGRKLYVASPHLN